MHLLDGFLIPQRSDTKAAGSLLDQLLQDLRAGNRKRLEFGRLLVIGERVFIGSNTMLVAPVKVGDEAMTATGGVITSDVPAGDMALARARQVNKPGLARKLFARLRAAKAAKKGG